jgi:hypothetical protein
MVAMGGFGGCLLLFDLRETIVLTQDKVNRDVILIFIGFTKSDSSVL